MAQAKGDSKDVFAYTSQQCPKGSIISKESDNYEKDIGKKYCIVLTQMSTWKVVKRYKDNG